MEPCCHGNKKEHKIGYNLANIRDTADNIATNRGFLRLDDLIVSSKFSLDGHWTLITMVTKKWEL